MSVQILPPADVPPHAERVARGNQCAKLGRSIAVPLLLTLVAVAILLYPVVVTQLKNLEQIRVSAEYSESVSHEKPAVLRAQFASAQNYNATRAHGPILDPWLARISEDNVGYQDYLRELDSYEVMGRLVIPAIKVDLPIYHGTGEDALQRGVGHLYGSDLPVGGLGTHAVLTGHSGLRNATLFDNLEDLREGDAIYIGVAGEQLKYEVVSYEVVLPSEIDSLAQQPDRDYVTLITCTPYGINSHRLLVHAERVPMDPAQTSVFTGPGELNWQWWMFVLVGGATALMSGMGFWAYKQVQAAKKIDGELVESAPGSSGEDS